MIKIEVTGNSIPEVADKLLAIGASLRASGTLVEVAEAAPTPKPQAPLTKSSTPAESTSNGPLSDQNALEEAKSSDPTPAPAPSASELDFELDVAPVVLRAVSSKGKPFVQDILSEFGSVRASQLAVDLWPELIARLEAEMA
jgi:hypothetical protein